ncbi:MAG: ComEA family DNA-binding protein [Pseudohongiellaceae bacterium]|nr:ComEA family DNA-binding protein [Pseudohongiellaceae bacterium]
MKKLLAYLGLFCSVWMFLPQLSIAQQEGEVPAHISAAKTLVDINSADAETLALALDGVGMAKAQDIVEYRQKNGAFNSVDDLAQVKGVGPATIARNRDKMTTETAAK